MSGIPPNEWEREKKMRIISGVESKQWFLFEMHDGNARAIKGMVNKHFHVSHM